MANLAVSCMNFCRTFEKRATNLVFIQRLNYRAYRVPKVRTHRYEVAKGRIRIRDEFEKANQLNSEIFASQMLDFKAKNKLNVRGVLEYFEKKYFPKPSVPYETGVQEWENSFFEDAFVCELIREFKMNEFEIREALKNLFSQRVKEAIHSQTEDGCHVVLHKEALTENELCVLKLMCTKFGVFSYCVR